MMSRIALFVTVLRLNVRQAGDFIARPRHGAARCSIQAFHSCSPNCLHTAKSPCTKPPKLLGATVFSSTQVTPPCGMLALGLRDRALIGLIVYSFAPISAVVNMKVSDHRQNGKRF